MKRIIAAGMLLVAACSVCAQSWESIGETEDEYWFASKDRIRPAGKILQVWTLVNYAAPQRYGATLSHQGWEYRSRKYMYHVDCGQYLLGLRAGSYFVGEDGRGNSIDSFEAKAPNMESVFPNSIGETLVKWTCDNAKRGNRKSGGK